MAAPVFPTLKARRRAQTAWCFFDWANSAFPTVIVTFVFAAYFAKAVAPDVITGTAQWGVALSVSGIAIAVLAPIAGAIADARGRRKPWLGFFSMVCIVASAGLWLVRPDVAWVVPGLVLFAIANLAFELGMVFYNAMLPGLVPPERIGRLSGWGWGVGYAGGLCCLTLALVVFVQPETPPFGLDAQAAEQIRIVGPLVAVWFALFSAPLFLLTPDQPTTGITLSAAVKAGLGTLAGTLRSIHRQGPITRFLVARILYIDGLNTLFAFGGIYAAGTFGMGFDEIILFGIGLNLTAGIGAATFAWVDDHIGPKRTILISLAAITAFGVGLLLVDSKTAFWVLALCLGVFVGPAQAASRSLMARLAPPEQLNEMFGLFALSGKATAFFGPALLAAVTAAFQSQRAGMSVVMILIFLGALVLMTVRVPGSRASC